MLGLQSSINTIEKLLLDETLQSLSYAALECRLAIELICYERLRIAHDYISHDDVKRWQPKQVIDTLIQDVDKHVADTYTISISKHPVPEDRDLSQEEFENQEYQEIGTQVGFNPKKLAKLWHGLANTALHVSVPKSKVTKLSRYGDEDKIKRKVQDTLKEIKRISESTLLSSGIGGDEVKFDCFCGKKNKRRAGLLDEGQIVNCIDPNCKESYLVENNSGKFMFERRKIEISCKCGKNTAIEARKLELLKIGQSVPMICSEQECQQPMLIQYALSMKQENS